MSAVHRPPRRDFLRSLALGAAAASLPRSVFAQTPASTKLTDKVSLISGAGNHIVALTNAAGTLLVDCGDAAHADAVLKLTGAPKVVYNTHWHLESTGGNDVMAKAGAKLVSHIATQLWMTQEIIHDSGGHDYEQRTYPPRAPAAMPTGTFREDGRTTFGDETIEYGLLWQAHTDGDIFVHFMNADVLVVGDAVQPGRLPTLDWFCGGWIGGMQNAQKAIVARATDKTKIVAASGAVLTKADVAASLETITQIRENLVKLMKSGKGAQDWIDAHAVADFQPQLAGDPDIFLYTAYRGLWAHARELGGIV